MAIRDADLDARSSHERALVDRFVRTQEPDAFSALVTSTRPWLVSTCTRMLGGDRYMAEDVAQDCYVKAFGFLANGGSPMDFRAWLSAVARNACIDEIRKTRAVPVEEVPEPAAAEDDLELDAPLETAWTGLQPRQRQLIFLREFLGMSYREIAAEMATSLPAVETALFRARSSLRRQYRRAGGTAPGLVWLGFGLRGLLRGGRSSVTSAPTRWATWTHDRVKAILARLPSSSPSDLIAGAAGLTAVVVLAASVFVVAHGAGGGPSPPAPHGKHAGVAAVAAVSHARTAHPTHRSGDGPARTSTGSRTSAPRSPAGQDATDALAQSGIQKFSADTLGATGQVVQKATDAATSTTDTVSKTVTNTVSKTVKAATSAVQQTESSLPGLPGS